MKKTILLYFVLGRVADFLVSSVIVYTDIRILSLVRSITYTEEIGIAMQAPVAALTVVFCADTYMMEMQTDRREVFRLCDDRKQSLVIYRRLEIQIAYLIAASVPGYLIIN